MTRLLTVLGTLLAIAGCQGNSGELRKIKASLSKLTKKIEVLKTDMSSLRAAVPTTHSKGAIPLCVVEIA